MQIAVTANSAAQSRTFSGSGIFAGVYFGSFENEAGHWAMAVSWQGEPVFDFIGRPDDRSALVRSYPYAEDFFDDGQFHGATSTVDGRIVAGRVLGAIDSRGFAGEVDRGDGPTSIFAGLWRWAASPPYPAVEVIVGPSGKALVASWRSFTEGEDALTRIDANGEFAATLSGGTRVRGRIDVGARRLLVALGSDSLAPAINGQARLVNFSVFSAITPATPRIIQQFSVVGEPGKNLLLRAVATPLELLQPGNYLENPALEGWDSDAARFAANDDWPSDDVALLNAMQQVGALPLTSGSHDAAQLVVLEAGEYTLATRSSQAGAIGAVLTEIFDLGPQGSQLNRLVSRGRVEADDALVSGFVISGDKPALVLVRGIGPKLAAFGVSDALTDPHLKISTAAGVTVAQNDDWDPSDAPLVAAMRRTGGIRFREPSKDAAMLLALAPGAYVASVRGAKGASGTAQIEIGQPQLARAADAALALELFRVEAARTPNRYEYEPQLWVYATEAASPVVISSLRFRLLEGEGERVPEWRTVKGVAPGQILDINARSPAFYGDPEFAFSSGKGADHVAVTVTFAGPDKIDHSITAITQVTQTH